MASAWQFSDPTSVYAAQVAPRLSEYMGWSFSKRYAANGSNATLNRVWALMFARWPNTGAGMAARRLTSWLNSTTEHFYSASARGAGERVNRLNDLSVLQAKVASLPEARWRKDPQ